MKLFNIYILIFLIFFSCSRVREQESAVHAEEDGTVIEENFTKFDIYNTDQLKPLLKQKLQEYYDLLLLKNSSPDFSEQIDKQLNKILKETTRIDSLNDSTRINNITFLSDPENVSDSVQKIKFSYEAGPIIDSLSAVIKTTPVTIEDKVIWSTNISFEPVE